MTYPSTPVKLLKFVPVFVRRWLFEQNCIDWMCSSLLLHFPVVLTLKPALAAKHFKSIRSHPFSVQDSTSDCNSTVAPSFLANSETCSSAPFSGSVQEAGQTVAYGGSSAVERDDALMSGQSAFFGTASLKRSCDLAGPADLSRREVRNLENEQALGGIRRPDISVRHSNKYRAEGRKFRSMLERFVDKHREALEVIEAVRNGSQVDGFAHELLDELRREWRR